MTKLFTVERKNLKWIALKIRYENESLYYTQLFVYFHLQAKMSFCLVRAFFLPSWLKIVLREWGLWNMNQFCFFVFFFLCKPFRLLCFKVVCMLVWLSKVRELVEFELICLVSLQIWYQFSLTLIMTLNVGSFYRNDLNVLLGTNNVF